MTRKELIEILSMDGTLEEMQMAVAEKELTEKEYEIIFAFLESEDKDRYNKLFDEIFRDVENIPVRDDLDESLKDWKKDRADLLQSIKDLKDVRNATIDELAKYDEQLEYAKKMPDNIRSFAEDNIKKEMKEVQDRLEMETKQISALSLMHAYAKSQEAQVRGQMFAEATQPIIGNLKREWEGLGELAKDAVKFVKDAYQHHQNAREALNRSEDLGFHIGEDIANKWDMSKARVHVRESNELAKETRTLEEKILKKANKIEMKEFKKNQAIERLKNFGKGIPKQEFVPIRDVEKAKEILRENAFAGNYRVDKMQKSLDKLRDKKEKHDLEAQSRIKNIQQRLADRRAAVEHEAQRVSGMIEKGELGNANRAIQEIEQNLTDAYNKTFIDFGSEIKTYMQENGIEDPNKIKEEPVVETDVKPVEVDGKNPEQVGEEIEEKDGSKYAFVKENGVIRDATFEEIQELLAGYAEIDIGENGFSVSIDMEDAKSVHKMVNGEEIDIQLLTSDGKYFGMEYDNNTFTLDVGGDGFEEEHDGPIIE